MVRFDVEVFFSYCDELDLTSLFVAFSIFLSVSVFSGWAHDLGHFFMSPHKSSVSPEAVFPVRSACGPFQTRYL